VSCTRSRCNETIKRLTPGLGTVHDGFGYRGCTSPCPTQFRSPHEAFLDHQRSGLRHRVDTSFLAGWCCQFRSQNLRMSHSKKGKASIPEAYLPSAGSDRDGFWKPLQSCAGRNFEEVSFGLTDGIFDHLRDRNQHNAESPRQGGPSRAPGIGVPQFHYRPG
jgi:hypothetical protein